MTHTAGLAQGVLPQVAVEGHGHGPLKAYANPFTASTTATMSKALRSALISGRLGCNWEIAFTGAPATFLNLLTNWAMSVTLGWVEVAGGLNGVSTSPERRVYIVTAADTFVQPPSAPLHDDPNACTLYWELGAISAPTTAMGPVAVSVIQS